MDKNGAVQLVANYIAIWNESDDRLRQALIEEVFTPDARYTDPNIAARGTSAIAGYLAGAQRSFKGMHFTSGTVLAHHDAVHFSWQVGPAGGAPVVSGFDVAILEDGRIAQLYGFFTGY
ncbi:nuclear transport factor 2 family protein [Streptomyces polychromogenes]|uniref:Nuclear transport factor 2 family protein n=1 Tax=Streptomyces polychromogenes TaxID=67342 RepID=A0ABP3ET32_9ACTN